MRIKICGITRVEDARSAALAGADLIGLNFYSASPRYVGGADVNALVAAVEPPAVPVAVTVNPKKRELEDLITSARAGGNRTFSVVQLHGDEPASLADWLIERGVKVIKAFRVSGEDFAAAVSDWLAGLKSPANVLAVLLDTGSTHVTAGLGGAAGPNVHRHGHRGRQYGGTGRRFNWDWIASARERGELAGWPPLLLAGGLTPSNVAAAVRTARPWGVDVAGGVEVEDCPGIKSVDKIRDFIRNARTGGK
jgi:phosphoribosylanthranilate isomerase